MTEFKLSPIENKGKRVLTTAQLAECYETTVDTINRNFNRNKDRYTEGKHFYCLTGDELKEFFASDKLTGANSNKVRTLYLWTERGSLLHAKSLNTDKAWEVHDFLVENYFRVQQEIKQLSPIEMIAEIANNAVETERRLKSIEVKQQAIEERTDKLLDVFTMPTNITWHEAITNQFKKICYNNNLNYQTTLSDLYKELEYEVGCDLTARQRNKRKRMKLAGCTHTQTIKETSKIMLIDDDDALRLAFENIFRKFQVRYIHDKE